MAPWSVDGGDVSRAARRLEGEVRRTPILRADELDELCGAQIYCKAEVLQHTGSFKARGALNALCGMAAAHRRRGVVTYSSGNHGRALAWAARGLGVPCGVVQFDTPCGLRSSF